MRKDRGCVRPIRGQTAKFKCPICEGENIKCFYCHPTKAFPEGGIILKQCPRAIMCRDVTVFISHFYRYIQNLSFPDGQPAIKQPKKLILLFNIWSGIYSELKEQERKKNEPRP
jgi:hypothetical protein